MPLSLSQIRLVQQIAGEGTLTKAARSLRLTQSALSRQLAKLERQIKAPLFTRSGKRMIPTAAGQLIVERGQTLLDSAQALSEDVAALAHGKRGTIRLTAA